MPADAIVISALIQVHYITATQAMFTYSLFAMQANGALASVNLLSNRIGVEQAHALLKIKEAKPGLAALCGLRRDETELDLSSKGLRSGCATLLAPELNANGALVKLDISNNLEMGGCHHTGPEFAAAVATMLESSSITDLNISCNCLQNPKCSEVIAPALGANGVLASLNISGNRISSDQKATIKKIYAEKSIKMQDLRREIHKNALSISRSSI